MNCRSCGATLRRVFLDLGSAPPSNAFLSREGLHAPEAWLPLLLHVCDECLLVQVDEVERHDLLFAPDYVYFSSFSRSWVEHARRYAQEAIARLGLDAASLVVEIASNDGYLLQHFSAAGIPCLGVEPTAGTARVAQERGIETLVRFFGRELACELRATRTAPALVVGNNVLAHVPDLNGFVAGIAVLLDERGVASFEFPHLLELVRQRQFDTVYHEHFSYFSLLAVERVFAHHGLHVFDVESLSTHGGSLRIWCARAGSRDTLPSVATLRERERAAGMHSLAWYEGFQSAAERVKDDFLAFLLEQKRAGKRVAGYGAAAKGNTLLNFAGVRSDLLAFVCDASPHKQGKFLPGSRIPVLDEGALRRERPDFVVMLPWNLREEIRQQLAYIREWGGRFVRAVPELVIE